MRSWRKLKFAGASSIVALFALRAARKARGQYGSSQPADRGTIHYVSFRHRFVLTTIPKVASKSFDNILRTDPRFSGTVQKLAGPMEVVTAGTEEFFHFAFVRNPWDRVVSCYKDKIHSAEKASKLALLSRYQGLRPDMEFDEFVEWLCLSREGSDECADRHWISQHHFVADAENNIRCNFIGKLENSERDMRYVADKLGLGPFSLPMRHQSEGPRVHYNSRTLALVGERYSRDIEVFGYSA